MDYRGEDHYNGRLRLRVTVWLQVTVHEQGFGQHLGWTPAQPCLWHTVLLWWHLKLVNLYLRQFTDYRPKIPLHSAQSMTTSGPDKWQKSRMSYQAQKPHQPHHLVKW